MTEDESQLEIDVKLKDHTITIRGNTFECILYYTCPICKAPIFAFWKLKEGQKGIDENECGRALRDSGFNGYRFFESKNGQGFEYDSEKDPNKRHNHTQITQYTSYGGNEYYVSFMKLNPIFSVYELFKDIMRTETLHFEISQEKALEIMDKLETAGKDYFKLSHDHMKHGKPIIFFNKGKWQKDSSYTVDELDRLNKYGLALPKPKEKKEGETEENPDRRRFRIVTLTTNAGMRYYKVIGRYHTFEEAEKDLPRLKSVYGDASIRGPAEENPPTTSFKCPYCNNRFEKTPTGWTITSMSGSNYQPHDYDIKWLERGFCPLHGDPKQYTKNPSESENPLKWEKIWPTLNEESRRAVLERAGLSKRLIEKYCSYRWFGFLFFKGLPDWVKLRIYAVSYNKNPDIASLMIWNTIYDAHHGEMFGSIYADDRENKIRAGRIDYSYYDDILHIKIIEVAPEYRRKGIGRKMYLRLKYEFPNAKLEWGMTTEEGTKFRESIETKPIARSSEASPPASPNPPATSD